jgi:hypothetical protein
MLGCTNQCREVLRKYFIEDKVIGNKYTALVLPIIATLVFVITACALQSHQISTMQILLYVLLPVITLTGALTIAKIFKETRRITKWELSSYAGPCAGTVLFLKKCDEHFRKEWVVTASLLTFSCLLIGSLGIAFGASAGSNFHQAFSHGFKSYQIALIAGVTLSIGIGTYWLLMNCASPSRVPSPPAGQVKVNENFVDADM